MDKQYSAFIYYEKNKDIGISFPDFPGCISAGATFEEALKNGQEALEFHIEGMIEENMDIPDPVNINDLIEIARKSNDNPQIVWLTASIPERKVHRVNITVPEYALSRIDNFIAIHRKYKNRSAFLVESALEKINK